MKNVLYADCCIRKEESRTRKIADAFFSALNKDYHVEHLSLMDLNLRPLINEYFKERETLLKKGELNHPRFNYAYSFAKADLIVIAAPFYDLSFPSLLKIYIENICVDGITFHSTKKGLQGLCKASDLVYLTSRGGFYHASNDEQATPYLKSMCHFFGIQNFHCVDANGMDVEGFDKEQSLSDACENAMTLAKEL